MQIISWHNQDRPIRSDGRGGMYWSFWLKVDISWKQQLLYKDEAGTTRRHILLFEFDIWDIELRTMLSDVLSHYSFYFISFYLTFSLNIFKLTRDRDSKSPSIQTRLFIVYVVEWSILFYKSDLSLSILSYLSVSPDETIPSLNSFSLSKQFQSSLTRLSFFFLREKRGSRVSFS